MFVNNERAIKCSFVIFAKVYGSLVLLIAEVAIDNWGKFQHQLVSVAIEYLVMFSNIVSGETYTRI